MSRKLRVDPTDGWHHVMNRGVDRRRIFFDDEDRIEFGRCVALACRRFGVELHADCLMDNHFHLLLRCPDGHVSAVMDFMRVDVVLGWFSSRAGFDIFVGRSTEARSHRGQVESQEPSTSTIMQAVDLVIHERSQLSGRAVRTQRCAISHVQRVARTRLKVGLGRMMAPALTSSGW